MSYDATQAPRYRIDEGPVVVKGCSDPVSLYPLSGVPPLHGGGFVATSGFQSSGQIPRQWIVLILLGIAVAFAGLVLSFSSTFLITYTDSFQPMCDRNLVIRVLSTGAILLRTGTFILVFGMFLAGALSHGIDARLRGYLFITGAIIFVVGFGLILPFPLLGFFPSLC